jgi:hypothetical protein
MTRRTVVSIQGERFFINGSPTYPGRVWNGLPVEGLLMNARLVQGIFDDHNPATRSLWAYPDTLAWDPERNTREFIAALPAFLAHGMLAFTINLQGGSPQGYSQEQPWHNSALTPAGELRPAEMARLERILERADELGMVVILGVFYFGQAYRLETEAAVRRAVDRTVEWVLERGYQNVLLEINNECDIIYNHAVLRPPRVAELIRQAQAHTTADRRLLVSTSFSGCAVPAPEVVEAADFLLLHGNGAAHPEQITRLIRAARALPQYRPMPVLVNEDDHFDFDQPDNNLLAALREYAGWGFFDYRMAGEGFDEGYQSVPVNWGISSQRKRGFFSLLKEITGS